MEKKQPILTVRPRFDPTLATVEAAAAGAAGAFLTTFLLGTFLFIIITMTGLGRFISGGFIYITLFVLSAAFFPAAYYELKRKALQRTAYFFYDEHLEYQDFRFYFTRRRGRVRYADIDNIVENANALQTKRMLTTVYLLVPGMPFRTSGGVQGLKISDIPESARYDEQILAILENYAARAEQEYFAQMQAQAQQPKAPPAAAETPPAT